MIAHATGTKLARLTGRTRNEFRDRQAHALRAARWRLLDCHRSGRLIDRVMRNPILNANTAVDEAHHRVSAAGLQVLRDRDGLLGNGWPPDLHRPFHERNLTNISRSPRVNGLRSVRTSTTRWRNSMCPRRSTRNCSPSWRAPRATSSPHPCLCDDSRLGTPWMWTLVFGHHEDGAPTHGCAATREDAMAAFAKSWRRE